LFAPFPARFGRRPQRVRAGARRTARRRCRRFYRHYGVERESWHLQFTDHGPWVIAVTELADPTEAAPRYADANEAFHLWFKSQVETLTGVDPNIAPLGPPTKEVFVWQNHASATQGQAATPA
jgi:hypothetical protein